MRKRTRPCNFDIGINRRIFCQEMKSLVCIHVYKAIRLRMKTNTQEFIKKKLDQNHEINS